MIRSNPLIPSWRSLNHPKQVKKRLARLFISCWSSSLRRQLTLPGKRESNLPCLFNGRKNRKISALHICKSVKWRCACCICAPAKLGDKIPAKGTWNWNHHEIWRGGICWTALIWENGGKFNRKKTSMFKQNLDFQKNLPLVVGEDSFPMEVSPLSGIFWSQSLRQALHVWPVPADSTTGTFQRSKNGRFFFDRKKSQVASAL